MDGSSQPSWMATPATGVAPDGKSSSCARNRGTYGGGGRMITRHSSWGDRWATSLRRQKTRRASRARSTGNRRRRTPSPRPVRHRRPSCQSPRRASQRRAPARSHGSLSVQRMSADLREGEPSSVRIPSRKSFWSGDALRITTGASCRPWKGTRGCHAEHPNITRRTLTLDIGPSPRSILRNPRQLAVEIAPQSLQRSAKRRGRERASDRVAIGVVPAQVVQEGPQLGPRGSCALGERIEVLLHQLDRPRSE